MGQFDLAQFDADVLELLNMVRRKPISYLGAKSITRLRCYLDGFAIGYDYPRYHQYLPGFQDYIEKKYHWKSNDSFNNILLKCTDDEAKALDLFYKELDLFLKNHKTALPEAE